MRCPTCQHDNSDQARFCAQCGTALQPASGATTRGLTGQIMNNGQYRVVRALKRGGMGAIYLAENRQAFNRPCVIKELIAYYQPHEEQVARERFAREARTLASLKHPGIPDMYGYFSEGGHHYIVMEYIEGEDLEHWLERNAPSPDDEPQALEPHLVEDVVRFGVQVCRVLAYLASIQPEPVVHCDIKPANIIIERNSDQAVLVDFGTAKTRYVQPAGEQPDKKRESLYGTVGYAAPEMYSGQAVPASDVFALAATMYHLLTHDDPGDHPFQWPAMELVPPSLRPILEQALASDPEARCDAESFRGQLETYRAIQAGTLQPLAFPDGHVATTVTGVLDLSLRYWQYAQRILYDGSLSNWLRRELHDPVSAERAEDAVRQQPDLPGAGLDLWLRELNPRLPDAQVSLSGGSARGGVVDLGTLEPGQAARTRLTLTNTGPGGAHGAITAAVPWLEVYPSQFALGPGDSVPLYLRIVHHPVLRPGLTHTAQISAQPANGRALSLRLRLRANWMASKAPATSPPAKQPPAKQPTTAQSPPATPPPTPSPTGAGAGARASRPANRRKSRFLLWLVLALVLGLGLYVGFREVLLPLIPLSAERFEEALDEFVLGLDDGSWRRAMPTLARVSPRATDQVARLGQALDQATVRAPGGTLIMGRDDGPRHEQPVHAVDIDALEADRFEVTNVQYQRYLQATGGRSDRPPVASWRGETYPWGRALHPVRGVTWEEAEAYAAWAGKRLPTEAEWEWLGRGSQGVLYPWGDEAQRPWSWDAFTSPSAGRLARVGTRSYDTSAAGAMDLAGNVREWTATAYAPYPFTDRAPQPGELVAVRGGSFRVELRPLTARDAVPRDVAEADIGFRCVVSAP